MADHDHEFGPVYHRESPVQMYMNGWVDDSGAYYIYFNCGFGAGTGHSGYFNYTWKIYAGKDKDSASLVIDIPINTIGNGPYTTSYNGNLGDTDDHFYAYAVCGCDGSGKDSKCIDNGGLTIADIALTKYSQPTVGTLSITDRTTKSISVSASWTNGTNTATATVQLKDSNGTDIPNQSANISSSGGSITFDNIGHATAYQVGGYISDGTSTVNYPNNVSTSTKTLGCSYDNASTKQFSISADFHASVDSDTNYSQAGISKSDCKLYNGSNVEISNPSISYSTTNGSKLGNNRATVTGLTSYTTYNLKYTVTDGHNTVSSTAQFTTIFPYARVRTKDGFKKAIPYVYTNGGWHMAKGYICTKDNNTLKFKEFNGE